MAEAEVQTQAQPETVAVPKSSSKKLKKRWYPIMASKEFNMTPLGDSYVDDPQKLLGKVVKANLMNLTHESKKQNTILSFTVYEVKNNQGLTNLTGYDMLPAYVKRFTKRAKSKIDDSHMYTTEDGVKLLIKPIVTSRSKAKNSQLTLVRNNMRLLLTDIAKKEPFEKLMKGIISGSVQKEIKAQSQKYYSISSVVIRKVKRL